MTDAILDRLDELVASRSILEHPFYQAWTRRLLDGILAADDGA